MGFVDRVRKGDVVLEGDGVGGAGGYSAALISKGTNILFDFKVVHLLIVLQDEKRFSCVTAPLSYKCAS